MTRPLQYAHKFPIGYGKQGDTVLFVSHRESGARVLDRETWACEHMQIRKAKIIEVGFLNQFDHPLDVEVQFEDDGSTSIRTVLGVGFYCDADGKTTSGHLILCPPQDQPTDLKEWAEANNAVIVRHPASSPTRLDIRCGVCLGPVMRHVTSVESQILHWSRDRFYLSDADLEDSSAREFFCPDCDCNYPDPGDVEEYS